jgi:hypothetical protein
LNVRVFATPDQEFFHLVGVLATAVWLVFTFFAECRLAAEVIDVMRIDVWRGAFAALLLAGAVAATIVWIRWNIGRQTG